MNVSDATLDSRRDSTLFFMEVISLPMSSVCVEDVTGILVSLFCKENGPLPRLDVSVGLVRWDPLPLEV